MQDLEQDLEPGQEVDMTDEEIEAFNDAEEKKDKARKSRQAANRIKRMKPESRDKTIIRGIKGPSQIKVETIKKVGLDKEETSEVGETISIPKEIAIRLQDAGAVKVKL